MLCPNIIVSFDPASATLCRRQLVVAQCDAHRTSRKVKVYYWYTQPRHAARATCVTAGLIASIRLQRGMIVFVRIEREMFVQCAAGLPSCETFQRDRKPAVLLYNIHIHHNHNHNYSHCVLQRLMVGESLVTR